MYCLRTARFLVKSFTKTPLVTKNSLHSCQSLGFNEKMNLTAKYIKYLEVFPVSITRRFQLFGDRGRYGGQHNKQCALFPFASLSFLGLFKKTDEEKEDELILTIKRSVLCIQRGELQKAEKMLHIALRLAQQQQDADGITYVYDLLANLALEKGEFNKSEKLFVSVMQRLLGSGVAQDDNRIIHISLKLAEIYAMQADKPEFHTKAKEGFRFSIDALEKKVKSGDKEEDTILLLSLATEGDGKMLAQQGKFSEAKIQMQKALDLSVQSGADSDERYASLSSDLGALCSMEGDQDAAYTHLQNAVDTGRKADAENLPAFLVNLGLLSLYKGMKSEASQACSEAWKISRSRKNKDTEKEAVLCLEEIKKV